MKILFIDTWTKGLHNFLPIAKELRPCGVESLLVHRGSWGSEPGRPIEEVLDGLSVRDIRYYGTSLVYEVLRRENPDAVLLLNTDMISDRAVILAARALGIKTAYTMHGVMAVGDQREEDSQGYAASLRRIRFNKAAKYLKHTLPDYFRSGFAESWRFPFRRAPYRLVLRTFLEPERFVHYPPPSPELCCDAAFMWGAGYVELVSDLGYPPDRIQIVGHPTLDVVFRLRDRGVPRAHNARPTALFLEGALVEGGYSGWTDETRIELIEQLATVAMASGYRLLVKLHPGTRPNAVYSAMSGHDRWTAVQHLSLAHAVHEADVIVSHSSTSVTVALALGKPVFVPRWGISRVIPDYYGSAGVAVSCESLDQLRIGLEHPKRALESTQDARARFAARFFGPTDGRAIERITAGLIKLAKARRAAQSRNLATGE